MHDDAILAEIRAGRPAPLYLIHGPDRIRHEEVCSALTALIPPGMESLNLTTLDGRDASLREAVDMAAVPAFGGGRRIILMREAGTVLSKEGERQVLEAFLARPAPDACLILTASELLKASQPLVKAVAAAGRVVEAAVPKRGDLVRWLCHEARDMGKDLSPVLATQLVDQSQADRTLLRNELKKAAAHAGDSRQIKREDVQAVVIRSREQRVFDLIDAVAGGNPGQAVLVLRDLFYQGEAPLGLLALLGNQYRLIWQVAYLADEGLPAAEIARRLKTHPFQTQKALRQARELGGDKAEKALAAVLQTDVAIKSGAMAPELAMETLCVTLAR